jgi:hypothetical protein
VQQFKTGRLPNSGKPRIKLAARLVPQLAGFTPPAAVDYYSRVPASTWGMDGNDGAGDCAFAERDHSIKAQQVAAGNLEVRSSTAEIVAAYTAVTGYDPRQTDRNGNNPTDQGAEMQAVYDYHRKTGFTLGGKTDKILLFAELDVTDLNLVKYALAHFGAIGLGINFPDSAMDQFNAGQPWDVVRGSTNDGGHAIALVGYDTNYAYVVTWGRVQRMTWAFWHAYVEEAWVALTPDFVSATSGTDPLAETLYQLGQQFAAVTGKANPVPAPAPAPAPAPGPEPSNAFPAAAYEAWRAHPSSVPKRTALIAAVDAWLGRS